MPKSWSWLGYGALVAVLMLAGIVLIPRVFHQDPCDSALPFATKLGLQLSSDDEVVSCEWHSNFPDPSGKVMAHTASRETRAALLKRSGVTEQIERSTVSVNDGPLQERVRRPNLERSEQVYTAAATGGDQLRISYDDRVESGLLLTVWALEF